MGSQQPLAIDYGQASGWRKHGDLIDALPYVDPLTPEDKRYVDKLVEEEMRRSSKRPVDYLKELPPLPPSVIAADSLAAAELERIKRGEPMTQLDTLRYQLNPPPPSKRNDLGEWRNALDNAHSQLEHQELRLMNLELQVKYGANVWRAYNQQVDVLVKGYEKSITQLRQDIEETNRARKLYQVSAAAEMEDIEQRWLAAVKKNLDIEYECRIMEQRIEALQGAEGDSKEAAKGEEGGAGDKPKAMETD
mmetsp:Transcript_34726/g.98403  ORF Transcript_34726/g.98403 Transcript_34726/m.98403 type:complete len:249 (+) Transcript_34726:209-955(+)|eukprot:CAMPEP_0117680422 /NCGR_PEP_ID=MMETSP0804-20121206/18345_1 /TAXON_ID=1074897 /ORGANISM="Tetraselmis astigmatica, Strain CCMP880" /LENGTH=248 /DNA_ID=CAMNT_0005489921 /DNA_START=153 /DNA_END=899 /DNA_ORIENTATION=-